MKVVNKDLPTEGVKIGGIRFMPNEGQDVSDKLGEQLVERKGFKLVKKNMEVKADGKG